MENLKEIFSNSIFRIPDYQRGYSWEKTQLEDLWNDLSEIVNERPHYTGALYLEKVKATERENWSKENFYNVVDGQQRLTTISILIFELLKATTKGYVETPRSDLEKLYIKKSNISGNSCVYKFGYYSENSNATFLSNTIFEDSKKIKIDSENIYSKNLRSAKEFFRERIKDLNDEEKDNLFKKVTLQLQFDKRIVQDDLDVQAVFETMNNRGKPLSILEKLKNRLIYLTVKLHNDTVEVDKDNLRNTINVTWGKIYMKLGENADHILDEDEFLSAHLSLYRTPKEAVFSEHLAGKKVFEMFCNKPEQYSLGANDNEKEDKISYQKIEDYVISIAEFIPHWYEVHNSDNLIIKKILMLNPTKEVKLFLATILMNGENEEQKNNIFLALEAILFRNRIPGIGVVDDREPAYWTREIFKGKYSINSLEIKLQDLVKKDVSTESIIQTFRYLFTYERGSKGFHRWSGLKYFLFEYEEYLRKEFRETNHKVNIDDDFNNTTIEHIIPQNFENWNTVMEDFTNSLESNEQKQQAEKVLINTLGNLTILKGGKNASLGNKDWKNKKERFKIGSYNEIEISQYEIWTKDTIYTRGKKMLRFLEQKINGLILNEEDIKKILFYDDSIISCLS